MANSKIRQAKAELINKDPEEASLIKRENNQIIQGSGKGRTIIIENGGKLINTKWHIKISNQQQFAIANLINTLQ